MENTNRKNDYELLYMYRQMEDVTLHLFIQNYSVKVWRMIHQHSTGKIGRAHV